MDKENNLKEVLTVVGNLKKENDSIIEYIKNNDKTIKNNQKLLDLLSDKPDIQDRNSSLSDNIDELNKTLKGLPKSLKVEGGNKSFNFLDLLPIIAGTLAISYLAYKGYKAEQGDEKTPLEEDINKFNEYLKKSVLHDIVEPLVKKGGRDMSKVGSQYLEKLGLQEALKKVHVNEANKLLKSTQKELNAAKSVASKAWKDLSTYITKNPLDEKGQEVLRKTAQDAEKNVRVLEEASKSQAAKVAEETSKVAGRTVAKRIGATLAKGLIFVDKAARLWFMGERWKEKDYTGLALEGTGLLLSSVRDLAIVSGVGLGVAPILQGGLLAVDTYTTFRDIKNTFLPENFNMFSGSSEDTSNINLTSGEIGNANHCIRFFINKGFTPIAACGIAGNAYIESGFNPNIWETKTIQKHYGVFQWDKERRESFKNFGGKDITQSSLEEQYNFAIWEVKNYISGGISNGTFTINYTKSPEEAAEWWEAKFEISRGQKIGERKRYARKFYDEFQKTSNTSNTDSKLKKTSQSVPNPTSVKLSNASKIQQQKTNNRFKTALNSSKESSNNSNSSNQSLVNINRPTYSSTNYFGDITLDIQDQSWYNYQKGTGVTDAFKGAFST